MCNFFRIFETVKNSKTKIPDFRVFGNEILERMDMKFYLNKLAAGTMTMDDITVAIKDAYKEKTEWEEKGWIFVEGKTKYPKHTDDENKDAEMKDD